MGIGRWNVCFTGVCAVLGLGGFAAAAEASPRPESDRGATVGNELQELRTATSRTYRADDGALVTRIRASAMPVNDGVLSRGLVGPLSSLVRGNQFCWIQGGGGADERRCDERTVQVGSDGTNARRALLWFDLSGVPQQRDVVVADLRMYGTSTGQSEPTAIHMPSRTWGDATGPTWNKADAANSWRVPGGDFAASPAAVTNAGAGLNIWTITRSVQSWLDGSAPNNGMLVKRRYETTPNVMTFDVDDDAGNPQRPWLNVITYPRSGEQKRYTFERLLGAPGRELAVNVANGNLLLRERDVDFFDTDQDYALDRTYNSVAGRWTDRVETSLTYRNYDDSVLFSGPSGEVAAFFPAGNGAYTSAGEFDQVLARAPNGTYTVTDPETQRQLEYGPNNPTYPVLSAEVDARGGRLAYVRDQRPYPYSGVASISDDLGRVTRLDNYEYQVTSITDPDGGLHRFGYTNGSPNFSCDDGTLQSHTDPAGGVTTYAYGGSNDPCMVRVTDIRWPDGSQARISYNVPGFYGVTVREVTLTPDPANGRGETTSYVYGDGYTTSTAPDGRQTTYWYDAASRVTRTTGGSQPPSLTLSGALWNVRESVLAAGEHALTFDAADSAGIAAFRVDIDGEPVQELPRDCASSCPTTASASWTLDIEEWLAGKHTVTVTATDGDGSAASQSFAVTIAEPPPFSDGTIPNEQLPTPDQETEITTEACENYYGAGSRYCIDPNPLETDANALGDGIAPFRRSTRELIYGVAQENVVRTSDWGCDPDNPSDPPATLDNFPSFGTFTDLRVKRIRHIVPYNLLEQTSDGGRRKFPCEIRAFRHLYQRGVDAGADIMVSFQFRMRLNAQGRIVYFEDRNAPDRGYGPDSNYNYAPSQHNYLNNVRAFKREFPRVRTLSAWNEPNYKTQPTRATQRGPRRAALYTYLLAAYVCHPRYRRNPCQVVASDAAGGTGTSWKRYLSSYERELRRLVTDPRSRAASMPAIWGFHPYGDVAREPDPSTRQTSTDTFIDFAPPGSRIWLTEVGSRVDADRLSTRRPNLVDEQVAEVHYLVNRLATSRRAISRVYYYSFCAPAYLSSGLATHDSGLVGKFPRHATDHPEACSGQRVRPSWRAYEGYTRLNPFG